MLESLAIQLRHFHEQIIAHENAVIRTFLEAHNITIEQAPELCIIDRFHDGSWTIRLQTDGDRMLLKLKQAQRAASDAIRLIPAAVEFDASKLDYAAIVVLCEQYAIIPHGMIESNRLADHLPASERTALELMIINAFIGWCDTYHAPKALRKWSEHQ